MIGEEAAIVPEPPQARVINLDQYPLVPMSYPTNETDEWLNEQFFAGRKMSVSDFLSRCPNDEKAIKIVSFFFPQKLRWEYAKEAIRYASEVHPDLRRFENDLGENNWRDALETVNNYKGESPGMDDVLRALHHASRAGEEYYEFDAYNTAQYAVGTKSWLAIEKARAAGIGVGNLQPVVETAHNEGWQRLKELTVRVLSRPVAN